MRRNGSKGLSRKVRVPLFEGGGGLMSRDPSMTMDVLHNGTEIDAEGSRNHRDG